ncbi:class II fructose-bisphosphate aldolase [Anoxynatronum buryatiense]|uniref:Fructose-bisphosphate aldolase, class II n=1 Tax=Anoxynatronum buryatiense TaxID=489973 RepID=A0AA45WSP4_9CLOT|nr:class II fructose-bisphosphate aldolase [Anoxynatronum buryatiense]SMP38547.1 fructose-bisphosphate aldolase, class II [Anoxynatronum buryatiense]
MKHINEYIRHATFQKKMIPGFNVFGYEDSLAVVKAAEQANAPVLLMVNRDARRVMNIKHWGALLNSIASQASVPVGVHLDHCTELKSIQLAIENGFTSVMYDGSKLPLNENIMNTHQVVCLAREKGVAVEGEVGSVPYDDLGETRSEMTLPEEAWQFCQESQVDWLAVSVGNIHRLHEGKAKLDFSRLESIESLCQTPLVIHGASGIGSDDINKLKEHHVAKVNIGTVLRRAFGEALRQSFQENPAVYDRLTLFEKPAQQLEKVAYEIICQLK